MIYSISTDRKLLLLVHSIILSFIINIIHQNILFIIKLIILIEKLNFRRKVIKYAITLCFKESKKFCDTGKVVFIISNKISHK